MKQSLEDNAYRVEFEMEDVCWHNKTMVILIGLQASGKYLQEQRTRHSNIFEELKLLTDNMRQQ